MAKRVSLRGKGADIFFGNYQPTEPPAPESPEAMAPAEVPPTAAPPRKRAVPIVAPTRPSRPTSRAKPHGTDATPVPPETSDQASLSRRSKPASKQALLQASTPNSSDVSLMELADVLDYVAEPATITNSFRYTEQELSGLTDALYEIGKRHGTKLTKQDAARLGLNFVLWDYRTRGDASLLGALAQRRRRPRRAE